MHKKNYPPTKYPQQCDVDCPEILAGRPMTATYIVPIEQNCLRLRQAVLLAVHNIRVGVWNEGIMDAYLCTCSVVWSIRDKIWARCRLQLLDNETDHPVCH